MVTKSTNKPLREGVQPERKKGVQPSQDLDTSKPPRGGSGVPSGDSNSSSSSNSSNSGSENSND